MMGFKEALHAERAKRPPIVDRYLMSMNDTDRADAEALLRSDHSDAYVANVFTDEGYPLTRTPISEWRRTHGVR